jgi:hypothetical protein
VKVTSVANPFIVYFNTVSISGNSAIINLGNIPSNGENLRIEILNNAVTDESGNLAAIAPYLFTYATY